MGKGNIMKVLYKANAWKMIMDKHLILFKERGIQFIDKNTGEIVKNIKTSYERYAELYCMKHLDLLLADTYKHQIDIYRLSNGDFLHTYRQSENRDFNRNKLITDGQSAYLYSILYRADIDPPVSLITVLDCTTWKEETILKLENFYAFDLSYIEKERELLITGREFCSFPKSMYITGLYKGIKYPSMQQILYENSNKRRTQGFEQPGIMDKEVLYFAGCYKKGSICQAGRKDPFLKGVKQVAFSHNGKYIAYIKNDNICIYDYLNKYEVDRTNAPKGWIRRFEFEESDHYLFLRVNEIGMLYEINFGQGEDYAGNIQK